MHGSLSKQHAFASSCRLGLGLDWAATAKDLPEGVRAELTKKEALLREAYSGAVGYEIDHIECERERAFLYGLIESCHHEGRGASPSAEQQEAAAVKLAICRRLIQSDALDTIMSKRYGQVKRYGMEGGEGMLIAIDAIIDAAKGGKAEGGSHIVIGMPHRGRLNLLYGALGMPAEVIFSKLTGANELSSPAPFYTGDVLSHLCKGEALLFLMTPPACTISFAARMAAFFVCLLHTDHLMHAV